MTREHKLALIIGFSLILFVGILISDHLSKAGGAAHAPAADAERRLAETIGPLDVGLAPKPLPERSGGLERYRAGQSQDGDRRSAAAMQSAPQVDAEVAPAYQPDAEPLHITARDTGALGAGEALVEGAGTSESLLQSGWRLLDQVVTGIGETPFAPRPALEIEQRRGAIVPGAGMLLPEEPFVTHEVQRGESLFQIARKHYGAGTQWTRIRDANPDRIGADGMVRVGVTIRIPGVAPESQRAVTVAQSAAAAEAARQYTVRKNDTLGEIAQQLLGSARRRAEIIELNRDKIRNEDEIRIGMVLAIPAG